MGSTGWASNLGGFMGVALKITKVGGKLIHIGLSGRKFSDEKELRCEIDIRKKSDRSIAAIAFDSWQKQYKFAKSADSDLDSAMVYLSTIPRNERRKSRSRSRNLDFLILG
jgi:hypothetical protein